jgi:hypothetical protein
MPSAQQFKVMLEPVDGRSFTRVATPGKDGAFLLAGVPPGRYFLRSLNDPEGWFLKDAQQDVTCLGFFGPVEA